MTRAQRAALEAPCRFAFETAHDRYAWILGPRVSLVLSVNSGYE
jgi:hypothetical protein